MQKFTQFTDPLIRLPSGRFPRCRYSTPIQTWVFGRTFVAPRVDREKIKACAKRVDRTLKIENLDADTCRVTMISPAWGHSRLTAKFQP